MKKVHKHIKGKLSEHNLWTHFPKDPNCPICARCKKNRAQCRQKVHAAPDDLPVPKKFADAITCDHKVLNQEDASRDSDRLALVVQDRFTQWLQGYPSKTKTADECEMYLKEFVGPQLEPQHVYSDNAGELVKALETLKWRHDTSTPHRSETNGVAERAVRKVKEGTACTLVQSGFDEAWWGEAMRCFCFLKNIIDQTSDETAYKRRFGVDFAGPLIPFGAHVEYLPKSQTDKARVHEFGSKMLQGIFVGYHQGSGGSWSKDVLVAD